MIPSLLSCQPPSSDPSQGAYSNPSYQQSMGADMGSAYGSDEPSNDDNSGVYRTNMSSGGFHSGAYQTNITSHNTKVNGRALWNTLTMRWGLNMTTFHRRHFQVHFPTFIIVVFWMQISVKFVPKGPSKALVQVMDWHWIGDRPLLEPMLNKLCDTTWIWHD